MVVPESLLQEYTLSLPLGPEFRKLIEDARSDDMDLRLEALCALIDWKNWSSVVESDGLVWYLEGNGSTATLTCINLEGQLLGAVSSEAPLVLFDRPEYQTIVVHSLQEAFVESWQLKPSGSGLEVTKERLRECTSRYSPGCWRGSRKWFGLLLTDLEVGSAGVQLLQVRDDPRVMILDLNQGKSLLKLTLQPPVTPKLVGEHQQDWMVGPQGTVSLAWRDWECSDGDDQSSGKASRCWIEGQFYGDGEPLQTEWVREEWLGLRCRTETCDPVTNLVPLLDLARRSSMPLSTPDGQGTIRTSGRDSLGQLTLKARWNKDEGRLFLHSIEARDPLPLGTAQRKLCAQEGVTALQTPALCFKRFPFFENGDLEVSMVTFTCSGWPMALVSFETEDRLLNLEVEEMRCLAYSVIACPPRYRDLFGHRVIKDYDPYPHRFDDSVRARALALPLTIIEQFPTRWRQQQEHLWHASVDCPGPGGAGKDYEHLVVEFYLHTSRGLRIVFKCMADFGY